VALSLKDAFPHLPASGTPPAKMGKARLKALAKHFEPHVSEPKNSGVKQAVGPKMIRAVANTLRARAKGKK
jgi:hypothetical protein